MMHLTRAEEEEAKDRITDGKLILAASVLLIVSGFSLIALKMTWMWDIVLHETNRAYVMEMVFGNIHKQLVWIAVGVLMLLFRRHLVLSNTIGILSWVLGLYVMHEVQVYTGMDALTYILEVTSSVLAFGLLLFGTLIWMKQFKFARALGVISLFYVAYELLNYRMSVIDTVVHQAEGLAMFVIPYLPYTALMVLFTYMIVRPSIMPPSLINSMTESASRVIDTNFSDADSYLVRSDIMDICDLLSSPCRECEGAIETEKVYTMVGPMRSRSMTVRRWKDEEFLRATIGSSSGSFDGFRFQIKQIVPDTGSLEDCGSVRIYGELGMYVDITIRDRKMSFQELSALEYHEENRKLLS